MNKFWMVYNQQGNAPKYEHQSLQSAQAEAERLAKAFEGQTFHILEKVNACKKISVVWDLEYLLIQAEK